ncbi:MAG: terminase, partial [Actinobacteria bacterium]
MFSNAGFDAEHSWQWRVRSAAESESWGYLFSAPGIIASWVRPEWVARMERLLPRAAFDRVILNRWTAAEGDFVTPEQWGRCVDPDRSPQTRGAAGVQYFAGLDLGLTKDRTALAILHREGDVVILDDLVVWQGTRAEPVDIGAVERALTDA